ncbi:MAG: 50S ribosomal protein L10 [Pirellulales bacterium]
MSKYVKELISDDLRKRFEGVNEALLVNIAALNAEQNFQLRKQLRGKSINLLLVKNSLARRACEGTPLAAGFEGLEGQTAVMWGGQDIVTLAKEFVRLSKDKQFAKLEGRGGVLDGVKLAPDEVERVSKWPTRDEQLSILLGQIMSPATSLSSQLISGGGALASQIKQRGEGEEGGGDASPDAPAAEAAAAPA